MFLAGSDSSERFVRRKIPIAGGYPSAYYRAISGVGYIYVTHSNTFGSNSSNVNAGKLIKN